MSGDVLSQAEVESLLSAMESGRREPDVIADAPPRQLRRPSRAKRSRRTTSSGPSASAKSRCGRCKRCTRLWPQFRRGALGPAADASSK